MPAYWRKLLDYFLFQKLYPGFTIAPCGGADQVVHATRSFAAFESFHRHTSCGIIDRDYRDDDEVEHLKSMRVFVLAFSEIENLLLSEQVLYLLAKHQRLEAEFSDLFESAKDKVFKEMTNSQEQLISSITAKKVEQKLKNYDAKARGKKALESALSDLTSSIDVGVLYDSTAKDIEDIIETRDYDRALRIYNNKGLLSQVAPLFGFSNRGLLEFVKRVVSSEKEEDLVVALRKQVPSVSV